MQLINELEVVIITFNRLKYFKNTLAQVFSSNSPIKNCQITILDNHSTDGTSELCKEYAIKYQNIQYIRHNRNIGGNGNIARAFEIASKKYIWVVCDDDDIDWTHWNEVEKAINGDADIIVHSKCELKLSKTKNLGKILRELTLLPGAIYKTELITNDVMQNIMANIINMFPHLAISCYAINENKKIVITEHEVLHRGDENEAAYIRSYKDNIHPRVNTLFFIVGYINSLQMIKDKKLKTFLINNMDPKDIGFFRAISKSFKYNLSNYGNSLSNICDVFCGINLWQKLQFLITLIWIYIIFLIKKIIYIQIK